MTETILRNFLLSGLASDAIKILQECKDKKLPHIAMELGKFFQTIFPGQTDVLLQMSYCAFDLEDYSLCYELTSRVREMNIAENFLPVTSNNQSICIPHIADKYIFYSPEIIQKIINRPVNTLPMVTFTITTCKRFDLFEKTMNSFLNCCTDLDRIDKWLCVDDNSNEEDRGKMREKYPFFEFYFKTFAEKGHPQSMNIIRNKVTTPYIFHMEDDWKFFAKKNYISKCMDVLSQSDKFGQCLINKNYAETEKVNVVGGFLNRTNCGTRYYLHQHCESQQEYNAFMKMHGDGPNCAYWKHFSFRPSLLKRHILEELGSYNEKISHFEKEYSERYYNAGYLSTFLDDIYCLHIGRLTSERSDQTKVNAYVLNGEKQFEGKEEVNSVNLNMKTYVLNLDKRSDRWDAFIKHDAPKCLNYKRFSVKNESDFILNKQLQKFFRKNDSTREEDIGHAISHIKLWIELVNSEFDFFCILEDDIDFVPNFLEKFLHAYSSLPKDWDICFLGQKYNTSDNPSNPILEKLDNMDYLNFSIGVTGGYIISRKAAKIISEIIKQSLMITHSDSYNTNTMNVYYCKNPLIYKNIREESKKDTQLEQPSCMAYILNLDRRTDRWKHFMDNQASKISHIKWKRFSAIDGQKIIASSQLIRLFEGNDYHYRKGIVGCAISHISMWIEWLYNEKSLTEVLAVFEDDVEFRDDFEKHLAEIMSKFNTNYDLLFLGHPFFDPSQQAQSWKDNSSWKLESWDYPSIVKNSMGAACGYLLTRDGARKLLGYIEKMGLVHAIDWAMRESCMEGVKVKFLYPHLVRSEVFRHKLIDSDIQFEHNGIFVDLKQLVNQDIEQFSQLGFTIVQPPIDVQCNNKIIIIAKTVAETTEYLNNYKDLAIIVGPVTYQVVEGFKTKLKNWYHYEGKFIISLPDTRIECWNKRLEKDGKYSLSGIKYS
jgi:GR25 family glycosyltransferase involved in LPS biosynthesis